MQEKLTRRVDLKEISFITPEIREYPTSASVILELGGLAMRFARVERVPRYDEKSRESDVEHSYMLGMVASELAHMLYPDDLNASLVNDYAMVHDLIEIKTGDVATFQLDDAALLQKELVEKAALESLLAELPPRIRKLLYNYEDQADRESRFTRAVDKLLPVVVDILGAGHKIMNEDYNVHSTDELVSAHDELRKRMAERFSEFPQLLVDYSLLCDLFEMEFDATELKQLDR
jgi:5'-deoxynucleotidase YfbR-like HD superfamily hydrolase